MHGRYREGEAEDFLDEVGGRDGAEDSLDAVLLLLHVGLLVELIDGKTNRQTRHDAAGVSDDRLDSVQARRRPQRRLSPSASCPTLCCRRASAPLNTPGEKQKQPCISTDSLQRPPAGHREMLRHFRHRCGGNVDRVWTRDTFHGLKKHESIWCSLPQGPADGSVTIFVPPPLYNWPSGNLLQPFFCS